MSVPGRARSSLRSWARTLGLGSRVRGRRCGRIALVGCGGGEVTGREVRVVVRWERDSRRWVSDLELRRER